ncbi:Sodium/hydrogen exchanger family-domain-containing protein [Aspergillus coremiiformis]|uniref:Sodium/hydrogen exchanger family-domain-containing protein n=1 Tax=Aspergillus coremiiformis TaxID=138285 RepID=A0A5N6ZDI5_9EURO|nr:Sodium/hydrogen exchanger family-domain-containing protein [Aspergillus coremiiformis]
MAGSETAFAYHEPAITTILNQAGFLLVLNLVNVCLDKLVYCGLIGQLFIGILWGTPGAKWLDRDMETVIQQLGYLGLIMLVYEGGLSTSLPSLKANLLLSLAVAITGIGAPMGLSFILIELLSATPLQAFAAGAALSATSLGTTFTILSTTDLIKTRLGTVTTGAAMLDDVVGLVMVQIITNLGGSSASFSAVTVIRPVFVSIGFGVGVLLLCRFGIRPILRLILAHRERFPEFTGTVQFSFLVYTSLLVGLVAGATYAGTSSLFAAYLAGVMTSWIDDFSKETPDEPNSARQEKNSNQENPSIRPHTAQSPSIQPQPPTGKLVYEKYYHEPVTRILIPLFFASIGFAIPITEMFNGKIVWRGIVYAILMTIGKLVTSLWLVRISSAPISSIIRTLQKPFSRVVLLCTRSAVLSKKKKKANPEPPSQDSTTTPQDQSTETSNRQPQPSTPTQSPGPEPTDETPTENPTHRSPSSASLPPKPKSLYPASILGLAMVSRGEVGYLIASLAESKGIFGTSASGHSSETYLVIVWAISLCTLFGPICVGSLVKRVKTLQRKRVDQGGEDPLGVWGI